MPRLSVLAVIVDSAHDAIEAVFQGRKVGNDYGLELQGRWASYFRCYATQNSPEGKGGMLIAYDEALVNQVAIPRLHGVSRDAWKRYQIVGYQPYSVLACISGR